MNNKEIQKHIEQTLNSQKPDKKVLNSAKAIMTQKQHATSKRSWQYYVAVASSFCLFVVGIVSAVLSQQNSYNENQLELDGVDQAQNTLSADFWLVVAIVATSLAVLLAVVAIVARVKSKQQKK